ncbi:MAG: Ribose-5-phosphate isomerase B [Syntrophus sp. SKADARSKE-3]|nr:Ribose-5-phosphate isomerase B [Syntrophus sp. SKADARSKE-3]
MNRIVMASDHGGFDLKEQLKVILAEKGFAVTDMGSDIPAAVDYPEYAASVAKKVSDGEFTRGILICGSGAGMAIVANKFPRIRAVMCLTEDMAQLSRLHNDANILVLAGRLIDMQTAVKITDIWLNTPFEGGRHQRRLDKIRDIEAAICK